MPQAVLDFLAASGLPGVVIIGMGWWILRQDARIVALQTELSATKDARTADAQKMAGEALELSGALNRQTELLMEIKGGQR